VSQAVTESVRLALLQRVECSAGVETIKEIMTDAAVLLKPYISAREWDEFCCAVADRTPHKNA
jgi:hypothetical protein